MYPDLNFLSLTFASYTLTTDTGSDHAKQQIVKEKQECIDHLKSLIPSHLDSSEFNDNNQTLANVVISEDVFTLSSFSIPTG